MLTRFETRGSPFLHGEDAWFCTSDRMCMFLLPQDAFGEKRSKITDRADDSFVQLLADLEKAIPVKPSMLTTELRVRGEDALLEARRIGKTLVMDQYLPAARVHGEVTWHGTDEYSPVYAINTKGAVVAVLFPLTLVPKSKA